MMQRDKFSVQNQYQDHKFGKLGKNDSRVPQFRT